MQTSYTQTAEDRGSDATGKTNTDDQVDKEKTSNEIEPSDKE